MRSRGESGVSVDREGSEVLGAGICVPANVSLGVSAPWPVPVAKKENDPPRASPPRPHDSSRRNHAGHKPGGHAPRPPCPSQTPVFAQRFPPAHCTAPRPPLDAGPAGAGITPAGWREPGLERWPPGTGRAARTCTQASAARSAQSRPQWWPCGPWRACLSWASAPWESPLGNRAGVPEAATPGSGRQGTPPSDTPRPSGGFGVCGLAGD